MDRFEEMHCFVQVARAGSFSEAARRLNMAKSTLSRRISDLEHRLGVQLFNRTTRRLHTTDVGEDFYRRASSLLEELDDIELNVSSAQAQLRGRLKVAAPLSFGLLHLRPLVSEFLEAHPEIDLELDLSDARIDIVAEGFDVALRIGMLADSSLVARQLAPVRVALASSPAYWDRVGRPATPRDLESMTLLAYGNVDNPGSLRCTSPSGERITVSPKVRLVANNGEFLQDAAADGLGFVLQPTFMLAEEIACGRLEPVLLDHAWPQAGLHAIYPPTRRLSKRVRAFIDALITRFADNPYWDEKLF